MDEVGELPLKEQTVVPPELASRMGEATVSLEADMQKPETQVAKGTEQMSMLAEFGQLAKDVGVKRLGLLWKDVKVAFGILPFVNKISEVITPASEATLMMKVDKSLEADLAASKAEHKSGKATKKLQDKQKGTFRSRFTFQDKATLVEKARVAQEKFTSAQTLQKETLDKATTAMKQAMESPPGAPEGRVSRMVRGAARAQNDQDYRRRYKDWEKDHPDLSPAQLLRAAANGEAPPRNKKEKFVRGAKTVGLNLVLEQLGPIINPVPDVPGLVTLGSYGAEVFGGQWWAGLVPPVWQYLHNRYEDMAISMETFHRATDIVKRHWNARTDKLLEAKIEKSANVFLPKKEMAASV